MRTICVKLTCVASRSCSGHGRPVPSMTVVLCLKYALLVWFCTGGFVALPRALLLNVHSCYILPWVSSGMDVYTDFPCMLVGGKVLLTHIRHFDMCTTGAGGGENHFVFNCLPQTPYVIGSAMFWPQGTRSLYLFDGRSLCSCLHCQCMLRLLRCSTVSSTYLYKEKVNYG